MNTADKLLAAVAEIWKSYNEHPLSYTSYILRVAYEEGETETLTAILSCAYSYEIIAKKIVENNHASVSDEFYGDWVKGYISQSYGCRWY